MEYQNVFIHIIQAADGEACFIAAGIAAGRYHHADAGIITPLYFHFIQSIIQYRQHDVQKVGLEPWEDNLRFRVAEAGVELNHLRYIVSRNHQAAVESALIGSTFVSQGQDGRLHNGLHDDITQHGVIKRRRGIAAHTARIRPFIAVKDTLIVAGRDGGNNGLAIGKDEEAHLPAVQILLDNDTVAGRPERFALHHAGKGFLSLIDRFGDDDPFSLRQAIGLDDDGRFLLLDIFTGGLIIGEGSAAGAGNAVPLHQVFGEDLAPLYLGGGSGRTKDGHTGGLKAVDDAGGQRRLRADDRQVNF